jgi:hypothetical protein
MPSILPDAVLHAIQRLRLPETPYDHIEFGGWLVQRVYEDESGEFEVVVSLVVARVPNSPGSHA